MTVFYHPAFRKAYNGLPSPVKRKAERREVIFRNDPFDPRLKTHKLHGKLKNLWSFSIDKHYRVVFTFDDPDVTFLDAGNHSVYQ